MVNNNLNKLSNKVSNLHRFIEKYGDKLDSLTDQEIQLLILVSNGYKSDEIAQKLGYSTAEVETLEQEIETKLSIDSKKDYEEYAVVINLIRIWFDSLSIVLEKDSDNTLSFIKDTRNKS
ncbi:helix-turn-helix transcriptional regulator [Halalkalibaculum sp. DA384]|uniref:helix-turn-helix transcriptional regulator n=1 Tax=Halalkalibaculum sp. DA384 TaxID=3373606 RepID=UPI00375447FD